MPRVSSGRVEEPLYEAVFSNPDDGRETDGWLPMDEVVRSIADASVQVKLGSLVLPTAGTVRHLSPAEIHAIYSRAEELITDS